MWTEERFERAKDLLNEGLSASQIASRLGGGVTRHAVIGKLTREGLPGGAGPRCCKGSHKGVSKPRRTYDHDAILDRWVAGEPEQVIGVAVGAPPKTVRRIVCEARKLGDPRAILHGRFGPRKVRRGVSAPRPVRARVPLIPIEDMTVPTSLDMGVLALTSITCRWPTSDPPRWGTWLFCGHHIHGSSPYCEYHSRLAYQPQESRRRVRQRDVNYFAGL